MIQHNGVDERKITPLEIDKLTSVVSPDGLYEEWSEIITLWETRGERYLSQDLLNTLRNIRVSLWNSDPEVTLEFRTIEKFKAYDGPETKSDSNFHVGFSFLPGVAQTISNTFTLIENVEKEEFKYWDKMIANTRYVWQYAQATFRISEVRIRYLYNHHCKIVRNIEELEQITPRKQKPFGGFSIEFVLKPWNPQKTEVKKEKKQNTIITFFKEKILKTHK